MTPIQNLKKYIQELIDNGYDYESLSKVVSKIDEKYLAMEEYKFKENFNIGYSSGIKEAGESVYGS